MNIADIKRKAYFFYYTMKPFRFPMVLRHASKRAAAFIGWQQGFRIIDLSITHDCNYNCDHCSAALLSASPSLLTLSDYRDIVDQARYLDNLSWNITGGEPLLVDWLDDLIPVLEPTRNYISIQTNCSLLTSERASRLARAGVNCITTSLDSADENTHDRFRGVDGAYKKVFEGIRNAKAAGMQVLVGGTITHKNLYSADLIRLINKVNSAGAIFLFNLGVPCGQWKDREDIVFSGNDRKYLQRLMAIYPMTSTDHEVGRNQVGCPAGMEKIYITPGGEVLPCPFIQVSFGNCRKEPLPRIITRMRQVPEFNRYQKICVAAEDHSFQMAILNKIYDEDTSQAIPICYEDIYGDLNKTVRKG